MKLHMFVFELVGRTEDDPIYRELERTNGIRHYSFLDSIISTSLALGYHSLSEELICAVNFHAIACLHKGPGQYRNVQMDVGEFNPIHYTAVPAEMKKFIIEVNDYWVLTDGVALASYVMWRINHIHPFVNGNGRTARAMCFYVLCMKIGIKLGIHLPELIRTEFREEYIAALKKVDDTLNIFPLASLLEKIIDR